jgi:hypothetical protein
MNFTPNVKVGSVIDGILAIAVVGLIAWGGQVAPAPMIAAHNTTLAVEKPFQTSGPVPVVSAVQVVPASDSRITSSDYQLTSHWYKNKYWWKRNAPIVGGAGGGAIVGGLVGGGTGALVGGAVGGGGGYLYKRHYEHHHHYNNGYH